MKLKGEIITLISLVTLSMSALNLAWSGETDFPHIKRYPPGYYGAAYYSPRLYPRGYPEISGHDPMKWDRLMSRELGIEFPFVPKPYPWDYGRDLNFNFPDFNSNDWR